MTRASARFRVWRIVPGVWAVAWYAISPNYALFFCPSWRDAMDSLGQVELR